MVCPLFTSIVESVPFRDGLLIYAEQSTVGGIIMNSYGGYAKVTIAATPKVGTGVYAVSAITRSKAMYEPVQKTDIFKGFNYNDPIVATRILDQIQKLVDE